MGNQTFTTNFHNSAARAQPRSASHAVHLMLMALLRIENAPVLQAPHVHCAAAAAENDGAGASIMALAASSKAGMGTVEKSPRPFRDAAGMLFPRAGKGMVLTRSGDAGPARSGEAGPPSERRRLVLPSSSRPLACL